MHYTLFFNWPFNRPDKSLFSRYHAALLREFNTWEPSDQLLITGIYLGSGWAQTYPKALLLDMSGTLKKTLKLQESAEFSIEISPFEIESSLVAAWSRAGINRIVIRIDCDRDHLMDFSIVENMISTARGYIKNIAVDFYVSSVSKKTYKHIKRISTLPISHVSLYARDMTEAFISFYNYTKEIVQQNNFFPYEWLHFTKPGCSSIYATHQTSRKPNKGFGVAACSFDGINRTKNTHEIDSYIKHMEENKAAYEFQETLTNDELYLETLMMQLRTSKGIEKKLLHHSSLRQVQELVQQKLLIDHGKTIGYTNRGFMLENQILAKLIR